MTSVFQRENRSACGAYDRALCVAADHVAEQRASGASDLAGAAVITTTRVTFFIDRTPLKPRDREARTKLECGCLAAEVRVGSRIMTRFPG